MYFLNLEQSLPGHIRNIIFTSEILKMLLVSDNINCLNANVILKVTYEAAAHVLICVDLFLAYLLGFFFLFRFINIKQGLLT